MCECRQRLEDSLSEQAAKKLPFSAQGLRARLQGYAIMFHGPVPSRQYMAAEITWQQPTKGSASKPSRMRDMKEIVNVVASYCMFCGEKYPTEEGAKQEKPAHEG